ncbi:MAG: hypothetical protein QM692_17490 [Thermomicrobiales bacterium]
MRWFLSFWITVVICLIFAGVYAIIGVRITYLSPFLDTLLIGGEPPWWLVPALVSAVYLFVRVVLHRVLAYAESAIEASPRGDGRRGRRRAAIGNAAYTIFGNPTGLWLSPFAFILSVAATLAAFLRWGLGMPQNAYLTLLLTLLALYAVVVTSAMTFPDRPQPLRYVEKARELDPTMVHRDETTGSGKARGVRFGRRKPAAP